MYKVYDISGNVRCGVHSLEYQGEFMSVSSVVATIKSPTPIEFANGDYITFRGENFTLRYTPAVNKSSRRDTYGEAFVYENITFYAASDELTRCDFLDVVKYDNDIHYTSLPTFSFYAASVQELADRIQANLDRLYQDQQKWTVSVAEGTVSKSHNFSCQNIKCWDALVLANTELDLNFIIRGRHIVIGSVGSSIEHEFMYGKGNGLKEIATATNDNSAIVTRLRAYGSTRNIPYRYYNKLYIDGNGKVSFVKDKPNENQTLLISESMYLPNLMLPMLRDGDLIGRTQDLYNEDGVLCGKCVLSGTKGEDVYIDSITGIEKYGINEGTTFFDTDDEDDEDNIYPSMENMTAQNLRNAGFDITLDVGDNGNLDEILSAEQMTDDGYLPENGSNISPSSFKVTLKDIGFNIKDYLTDETAQLSFTSGALVGRTFDITEVTKDGKKQILTLTRILDDDIQWVFPNKVYNAKAGDKFVLLNIYMPDVYIVAAEYRLLERAKVYLAENDHNEITYTPKIDNIFLARHKEIAETIKEGDIFTFSDEDLGIYKSITISTLNIKVGESLIPEYEVTLSEDKDATLVDRITSQVSDNMEKTLLSPSNIVSQSKILFDKRYARKDIEETFPNAVTFAKGAYTDFLQSVGYMPDFGGSGYTIEMRGGKSYITTDNLYVRNKATFDTLEIRKVTHTGGVEIKSPASSVIAGVGEYFPHIAFSDAKGREIYTSDGQPFLTLSSSANAYKCYFKATDGEKEVTNDWQVGDLALCHEYNLSTGARYYWRRVVAVSEQPEDGFHWVALSYTDTDGNDVPMAGDNIVCLGSSQTERQNAIILASVGENTPYFAQLHGISDFSISVDKNVTTLLSPKKNIIKGHQITLLAEDSTEKDLNDELTGLGNEITGLGEDIGHLSDELAGQDETLTTQERKIKEAQGNIEVISKAVEKNTASLDVQSGKIEGVVSKTSQAYDIYTRENFTGGDVTTADDKAKSAVGLSKNEDEDIGFIRLHIADVRKGDRIRIERESIYPYIYTCDDSADDADQYAFAVKYSAYEDYNWIGFLKQFGEVEETGFAYGSFDFVVNEDAPHLYIVLSDDTPWDGVKVFHIKAALSAESRITQTAEEIEAKVGDTGINIANKTITLNAERTTVKGNLDIQKVACYYKDADGNDDKTKPMSEYNGSGNGTLVYYYPNGKKMREDVFKYDDDGNVVGLWTIYFNADGTIGWQLTETGFLATLEEYWSDLGNLHFTTMSETDFKAQLKSNAQSDTDLYSGFSTDNFSQYNAPTDTSKYKDYNGKIAQGKMYKQTPDKVTLFDGIILYSVSIKSQTRLEVKYEAVYQVVSSTLGELSPIITYEFSNV